MESQLVSRNYTPEAIKMIKSKMKSVPVANIRSLNVEFRTDQELTFDGFGYYSNLFSQYSKNGTMPFDGCLADQPAKIIEIFETFERLNLELEERQLKEMQRKK